MLEGFLKGLEQPEYIHVLINPLPVYGLAMGLVALIIGLALRSREARTGAFALILIVAASAWPVFHYGQQGYDRVKGMSDSEGEKWLDEHRQRGEQLIYVFYAVGALALVSIGAEWKRPKAALPLAIMTLVLATVALGIGGYIAYAGGHIRHKEFRFEPAPEPRTEEPSTSRGLNGETTQDKHAPNQRGALFTSLIWHRGSRPKDCARRGVSRSRVFAKKPAIARDFHVSCVKIGKDEQTR